MALDTQALEDAPAGRKGIVLVFEFFKNSFLPEGGAGFRDGVMEE
jgi:hypothetical protein